MSFLLLIAIGLVAGIFSGLLGIGGGVILVPGIVMVAGLSIHQAIGISLAVIIPTAISGTAKHFLSGNVDLKLALIIAGSAIIGAWLGASFAQALPAAQLKKVFAVFLILIGCNMLFGWTSRITQ